MAVIILVRRLARTDRLEAFRERYVAERPKHPGFIAEYLTRVDGRDALPPGLRNLPLATSEGSPFVNVAVWKSASDFAEHFRPECSYDPEIELAPRARVVLDIAECVGEVSRGSLGFAP